MKKVIYKKPYTLKTLPSGLRILTVPMDNPTVTALVLVEAGSKYETLAQSGLSHFLEHMCFKGTTKRIGAGAISLELDALGTQYNAFTGTEYTGYHVKGRATQSEKLIEIISDLYVNPTLPEDEIQKEKGVICDEINMYEDTPKRKVYDILQEVLYGSQPAGRSIAGTKEQVRKFVRKDFVAYRDKYYTLNKTIVVVAGDIDERKVQTQVASLFKDGNKNKGGTRLKVKQNQKSPIVKLQYKKTDQSHIMLGFRSCDMFDKDAKVMQVIGALLGAGMSSRLFKKVRDEMGCGYYVGAHNDTSTDTGAFIMNAGVAPERANEVVSALLVECARLKNEKVGIAELSKIHEMVAGSLFMGLESSDAVADLYGSQAILREAIKTPQDIEKEYKSVAASDIMRVAKKVFVDKNLNLVILGPHKNDKDFIKTINGWKD